MTPNQWASFVDDSCVSVAAVELRTSGDIELSIALLIPGRSGVSEDDELLEWFGKGGRWVRW